MQLEDELGDIIAKARVGNRLSMPQLAAAASLTEGDIRDIETYRLFSNDETIVRLADLLGMNGVKLAAIANGWTPLPQYLAHEAMIVETIHVPYGSYGVNAYILGCPETKIAAVIDPGGSVSTICQRLAIHELTPRVVLITHAHDDHIGGLSDMINAWPDCTVMGSPLDREAIMRRIEATWSPAEDGTNIQIGNLTATALSTPGHTPGSTCYMTDRVCFVGDTLFAGSIGRPANSAVYPEMLSAIRHKVLSTSDDTILFPGHGPATTVAEENAHNPFF